jgi:hypothetical protein
MSAVAISANRRVAILVADHGGDADAALQTCLEEIDRLSAQLARTAYAGSYGYTRGRMQRPAGFTMVAAPVKKEVLDV